MEFRSINNYIPNEVLKFLSKKTVEAKKYDRPVLDFIKTPTTTSHNAVVFFADVSGFTNLTETLSEGINNKNCFYGTDLLAYNLNQYMELIIRKLTSKGADIVKFAGDSLIAIFPDSETEQFVPPMEGLSEKKSMSTLGSSSYLFRRNRAKRIASASDGDARNQEPNLYSALAVWLAVNIQSGGLTTQFSVHLEEPAEPSGMVGVTRNDLKLLQEQIEMRVKIGISKGEIILAHIGGASDKVMSRRVEYVAVGKALQEAFACEGECGPGEICITPDVYRDASPFFGAKPKSKKLPNPLALGGTSRRTKNISFKKLKNQEGVDCYKVVGNLSIDQPMFIQKKFSRMFDNIADPVLWSYVPLTAKPYLQSNRSENELWVNEFRKVTTIFCQLGFDKRVTDGMAKNQQTELQEFNSVFAQIQHYVYLYEGQINKFLIDDKGNTLIIVFGLCPFAHDNDEARAVCCAVSIIRVCQENNLSTQVGVSTGMVYCGLFGSKKRKEYTVLGDSVNVAARLMVQVKYDKLNNLSKTNKRPKKLTKATRNKSKNGLNFLEPGPMYIDLPTRRGLMNFSIPAQFVERTEKVKVKGKSLELRIFYWSNSETRRKSVLKKMDNIIRGITCENINGPRLTSTIIPLDTKFSQLAKRFGLEEGLQLLWCKNQIAEIQVAVHPEETLAQMVEEAKMPSFLQFVTVPDSHPLFKNAPRLLRNIDFKYDLTSFVRPSQWPMPVVETRNAKGVAMLEIEKNRDINENCTENVYYECVDSFELVDKLRCFEGNVDSGLQIICLESGYGIGKTFAMHHVFNAKKANAKYFTAHIRLEITDEETNQNIPFKEIFRLVDFLLNQYISKEKGSKRKIIQQAFDEGKKFFEENPHPDDIDLSDKTPQSDDLWLLNSVLGTDFKSDNKEIITNLPRARGEDKKSLVRSCKDMMKIFMLDNLLNPFADEEIDALTSRDQLSVQSLCSVLCAVLAGFTQLYGMPIVCLFPSANTMCSFTWHLLNHLSRHWQKVDVTFVIALRVLDSLESVYKSDQAVDDGHNLQFPIETNKLTTVLLKIAQDSAIGFAHPEQLEGKKEVKARRRHTVRRIASARFQQTGTGKDDMLPYPIAKQTLHNEYLQARLRGASHSHFIEVRARKEYTEQIAKNILEVDQIDEALVKILETRTNGNATYVKESLLYYSGVKVLDIRDIKGSDGRREAIFDYDKFNAEFKMDVPIMVESYCSMIFDQVDQAAQIVLKTAAYFVSMESDDELMFTQEDIKNLIPFSYMNYISEAEEAFYSLVNSNIFEDYAPDRHFDNPLKIPYRFSEDWLRICVLRKLTNQQRVQFAIKSKATAK